MTPIKAATKTSKLSQITILAQQETINFWVREKKKQRIIYDA